MEFIAAAQALEAALGGADNEKKIGALQTLNEHLQTDSSPTVIYTASSTLTASFKLALKSPNGHVFLAALACLAPYFAGLGSPFDPDASVSSATGDPPSGQQRLHVLKHAISTLVSGSSGSILTGLGDAKEKTREAARTALVAAAHAASGLADLVPAGGVNEPLAELERIVKEVGFANKAARARAEICHYFTTIRLANPTFFPLRPYLPSLVTMLEDPDLSVRSAAQDSIVTIFAASGPAAVAPAAKTDLRKEMARQNVRKATLESISAKVFGGAPVLDDANGASRPGSSASVDPGAPLADDDADVPPFYVASIKELDSELSKMTPFFAGRETEHNWQARESSILSLRGMLRHHEGVVFQHPADFVQALRTHGTLESVLKALASLRTTLSVSTCSLLAAYASNLPSPGPFDPLANETVLPALLRMAPQTKRIVASASQRAAAAYVARPGSARDPRVFSALEAMLSEKTVQARQAGIEHFANFVATHQKPLAASVDAWATAEKGLKRALGDANPVVKEAARKSFWTCHGVWPAQATVLLGNLDAATRKAVEKANPDAAANGSDRPPLAKASTATTAPPPKRTSVKSMIAATRAAQQAAVSAKPAPQSAATRLGALESGRPSTPPQRSVSAGTPTTTTGRRPPAAGPGPRAASYAGSPLSGMTRPGPASASPVTAMGLTAVPPLPASGLHRVGSPPNRGIRLPSSTRHPTSPRLGANGRTGLSPAPSVHSRSLSSGSTNEGPGSGARMARNASADEPIVEEALKSNALQAVSAAERLLELVDPDDNASPPAPLGPGGVLMSSVSSSPPEPFMPSPTPSLKSNPDTGTPLHSMTPAASRWSAAFADSPAAVPPPSLLGGLSGKDVGWYHRHADMVLGKPLESSDEEVRRVAVEIAREGSGAEGPGRWKRMAKLVAGRPCVADAGDNGLTDASRANESLWGGKVIEGVFGAVVSRLRDLDETPATEVDSRLLLLRAIVLYLHPLLAGREQALFATLLQLRRSGPKNTVPASEAIAILAAELVDPLFGIGALRSGLEDELGVDPASEVDAATSKAYALALRCLGRCLGRLPAAVLEDEVVRVRSFIVKALNDPVHADLRLGAVLCLVAVHAVLRDQQQLFALTGGLTPAQEALLMYYCNQQPS